MAMLLTLWDDGLQAMCRDHPTPRCRIETPATILERSFVYGEWRMENGVWSTPYRVCVSWYAATSNTRYGVVWSSTSYILADYSVHVLVLGLTTSTASRRGI